MTDYESVFPWICVGFVVIFLFEYWRRNHGLPPGPWGLPIAGYYLFLSSRPFEDLVQLAKQYGNILSFRSVGGTLFIILSDLSLVREVLITRGDEFVGRPLTMNLIPWIDGGYGIGQAEGQAWQEQRKFFAATAKNFGFGRTDLQPLMHDLIQQMLKDFKSMGNKPFALSFHLAHVSANVVSHVLCQRRFSKNDPKFKEIVNAYPIFQNFFADHRLFLVGKYLEHFVFKFTPEGRKATRSRTLMEDFSVPIVEDHIRSFDPHHVKDYTDSYLNHSKNLEEKGQLKDSSFSTHRLKMIVMDLLMEGTDTVAGTITALLCALSGHQAEQKKAQDEIDDIVGRERLPEWADKPKMPYLDALILELFRTAQVFNISTAYSNFEETTIRGYRIPKRSFIHVNLYALNNDPKTYPNPSKFDPSRYLGEDGQRTKMNGPFPFGVGKRACIGESLAQMEVFLLITSILQNFTLYPESEYGWVRLQPR